MNYDFQKLDWRQFEILCGSVLAAEGFLNIRQLGNPGGADRGVDWKFDAPEGQHWVVQVKLLKRRLSSPAMLQSIVDELLRGMALQGADRALLMLSVPLELRVQEEARLPSGLEVWDAPKLESLIAKHESVRQNLHKIFQAQKLLEEVAEDASSRRSEVGEGESLIQRLEAISPGRGGATEYERVCIDILSFTFSPHLRPPKIQNWSEDGLDRRDAIFPIGPGSLFWDSIKYQHSSRLLVAEFKNYTDPISQTEVESLQQYLYPKARRAFGFLCSRHAPSTSAVRARRRAWMISETMILFLSDGDLKEMIRMKARGEEPAEILETQMNDFFLKLAP